MKNNIETQSAEVTKKTKSEASAAKESGPKSRLTAEAPPQQVSSKVVERAKPRPEPQRAAAEHRSGATERRSKAGAAAGGSEASTQRSRPRESLVGQNSTTDLNSPGRDTTKGDAQAGRKPAERFPTDRSNTAAKSPTDGLKSSQKTEQKSGQETDGRSDQKDGPKLIKPGEQIKVRGSDATVSKLAWENPGTFVVSNPDAQTKRIEGFISRQTLDRTSAEATLQKEAASRGGKTAEGQTYVGAHRIGDALGGPRVATHGAETTAANLEPGDSRINNSMLKVPESVLLTELAKSPDKKLFMQVDTRVGKEGRQWVTHRVFEQDKDGMPKSRPIKEITTREDMRTRMTVGQAVESTTGEPAKAFYTAGRGGTKGIH